MLLSGPEGVCVMAPVMGSLCAVLSERIRYQRS